MRFLFLVITPTHFVHDIIIHHTHGLPFAHRIQCIAHQCPRNRDISGSGDDRAVYCLRDTSVCCICLRVGAISMANFFNRFQ